MVFHRQNELFHINPCWSALPLPDALYQPYACIPGIQLREDFHAFGVAAIQARLYVFEREKNIYPVVFVNLVIFHGQGHTVKHQTVQNFSVA